MRDRKAIALVALAAALRLAWPTLSEFKRDEATVVREALSIAHGHWTAFGVGSSLGTANAPFFLYLAALPLRLDADPVALVLFIGLLNALAVAAAWWLVRRWLSPRAALVGAYLFALSGWAVLYGRKVWVRTLPLFVLAFIAALLAALIEARRGALVAAFAAAAALLGLQLEGLAFVVILGLLVLLHLRRLPPFEIAAGSLLFVAAFVPYLVADARLGWPNLRGLAAYAHGDARLSADALRYAFRLVGHGGVEGLAGPFAAAMRAPLAWTRPTDLLMGLLLVGGLLHALWRLRKGERRERTFYTVLLVWFLTPILLQSYTSRPVQPHYFVLLYPVQFILIAALIEFLLVRFPRRALRVAIFGLLAAWGAGQLLALGLVARMMVLHPSTGGYGIPLRYPRQAVRSALACAPTVVALSAGAEPRYDEGAAVFDALLFDHPHRLADARLALPLPDTSPLAFVIGPMGTADEFAPIRAEAEAAGRVWERLRLADGTSYLVFCRRGGREALLDGWQRFPADRPFANGVVLTGWRGPSHGRAGTTVDLWLAWWIRLPPAERQATQFYLHLLDGNGRLVAQEDANGYPVEQWRAGDLVFSRFPLALPEALEPGTYRLIAGLYTLPDVVPVPTVAADGTPVGNAVTLGTLRVLPPP